MLSCVGGTVQAKVVAKSTNLNGVQVYLTFPTANLQVSSVTFCTAACASNVLWADTVAQNTFNNSTGTISFAFAQFAISGA